MAEVRFEKDAEVEDGVSSTSTLSVSKRVLRILQSFSLFATAVSIQCL